MTGFGKAEAEVGNKKITVEVKSLNSKQLDLSLRLPALFRDKEADMRGLISQALQRGKVEVTVYVGGGIDDSAPNFNLALIREYHTRLKAIAADLGVAEPTDWMSLLMRLPEVTRTEVPALACEEESEALMKVTSEALAALTAFRRAEGEKLEHFFAERVGAIASLLSEVPRYETERVARIRTRIEEGLAKIPGAQADAGRLEQEMIYYIEKLDINEEKQRLAQHLTYFSETMDAPQSQGKKLGFISQEMGREINTLGSKSNQADMQRLVVRMKDHLEQIKEQVLNVL